MVVRAVGAGTISQGMGNTSMGSMGSNLDEGLELSGDSSSPSSSSRKHTMSLSTSGTDMAMPLLGGEGSDQDQEHVGEDKEDKDRVFFLGFSIVLGVQGWRLVALALCMLWSSQFAVAQQVFELAPPERPLHPATFSLLRFGIASLALLPTYYSKLLLWLSSDSGGNTSASGGDSAVHALVKGSATIAVCMFVAFFGQATAMAAGTPANTSAFIASLTVVWVPLLTGAMQGHWRGVRWLPILLSVAGIAFMELEGSNEPKAADIWAFLQPIGFGTAIVVLEGLVARTNSDDVLAAAGLRALCITCCVAMWCVLAGQGSTDFRRVIQDPSCVRNLLYLGCIGSGMGWYAQTLIQSRVRASDFALILCLEPVFACVFSAYVLAPGSPGAGMSWNDVLGGLLVVLGCALNETSGTKGGAVVSTKTLAPASEGSSEVAPASALSV